MLEADINSIVAVYTSMGRLQDLGSLRGTGCLPLLKQVRIFDHSHFQVLENLRGPRWDAFHFLNLLALDSHHDATEPRDNTSNRNEEASAP